MGKSCFFFKVSHRDTILCVAQSAIKGPWTISSSPVPVCSPGSSIYQPVVYLLQLFTHSLSGCWYHFSGSSCLMPFLKIVPSWLVMLTTVVLLSSTPGPLFACLSACHLSNPVLPASSCQSSPLSLNHLSLPGLCLSLLHSYPHWSVSAFGSTWLLRRITL